MALGQVHCCGPLTMKFLWKWLGENISGLCRSLSALRTACKHSHMCCTVHTCGHTHIYNNLWEWKTWTDCYCEKESSKQMMSLSQSTPAWILLPYQWEAFGILASHSYGLRKQEETALFWIFLIHVAFSHARHAMSQWKSHSAVLVFLPSTETTSEIPRRVPTEGNPPGHSPVLLMFFFF